MKINNLIPHIVTGEVDNSFVGMKIIGNQIHFYYPESYHFDPDNYERDDFLDLLKTISIAKSTSIDVSSAYDSRKEESNFALLSYIWVLEDYLKNGLYTKFGFSLKTNQRGKVNWKKTIQQLPLVSGRNIVYTDLISEVRSPQTTLLEEAHRYCVWRSIAVIGWVYGLSSNAIEMVVDSERMIPRYLEAIHSELERTFNDDNYFRLIHMENILIGLDETVNEQDVVYGVDTYHYIFEKMIDRIFGSERVDEYYPTFTWHLKYSSGSNAMSGPTIRPDTILKNNVNGDIYIIDSKFYRYGSLNFAQTKGLPDAASIVKQITYGSYVQSKYPLSDVFNVFILPYDSKSPNAEFVDDTDKKLVYVGEVSSDWEDDNTYGKIYTFLIDLRYVVKTWNRLVHDEDKRNLVDMVNQIKNNRTN